MVQSQMWDMKCLKKEFKEFYVNWPEEALKIIKKYKNRGYYVEWSCDDFAQQVI